MLEELLATINKCLASSTDQFIQNELHWVDCCAFMRAFHQSDSGINSKIILVHVNVARETNVFLPVLYIKLLYGFRQLEI